MIKLRKSKLEESAQSRWARKQELAAPGRFYGDDGTIHQTQYLDVETFGGQVVAVWFRCQLIAFKQTEVDDVRAVEMDATPMPRITGVQIGSEDVSFVVFAP
jgi:hypothetical protein